MKENLSQYVERITRQKGLNFADVERKCDGKISASYIGRILKGEITNLTTEKMVALAQGLGVDPREIFNASYEGPTDQDYSSLLALLDLMQRLVMNPEVFEAVELLLRLSPKERAVLLQPLKRISKTKAKGKKKKD
jgi:transcriptional regulator with XRE-family HTH domain